LSRLLAESGTPFLDDLALDGVLAVLSGREDAPFPIAEIGDVPIGVLPIPIRVPTEEAEIVSLATVTISEILRHLEWHDENQEALVTLAGRPSTTTREAAVEAVSDLPFTRVPRD
jgi:hypothetical protein